MSPPPMADVPKADGSAIPVIAVMVEAQPYIIVVCTHCNFKQLTSNNHSLLTPFYYQYSDHHCHQAGCYDSH